jgi:hypothetical protein
MSLPRLRSILDLSGFIVVKVVSRILCSLISIGSTYLYFDWLVYLFDFGKDYAPWWSGSDFLQLWLRSISLNQNDMLSENESSEHELWCAKTIGYSEVFRMPLRWCFFDLTEFGLFRVAPLIKEGKTMDLPWLKCKIWLFFWLVYQGYLGSSFGKKSSVRRSNEGHLFSVDQAYCSAAHCSTLGPAKPGVENSQHLPANMYVQVIYINQSINQSIDRSIYLSIDYSFNMSSLGSVENKCIREW